MSKRSRSFRKFLSMAVPFIAIALYLPAKAYAYLDPGTGSMIIQLTIGALLGAAMALKVYWGRLKTFLGNIFGRRAKANDDEN